MLIVIMCDAADKSGRLNEMKRAELIRFGGTMK